VFVTEYDMLANVCIIRPAYGLNYCKRGKGLMPLTNMLLPRKYLAMLQDRKKNFLYFYKRNTIPWKLSCDKGEKTRSAVAELFTPKAEDAEDAAVYSKYTTHLSNLCIAMPILIAVGGCLVFGSNHFRYKAGMTDNEHNIFNGSILTILMCMIITICVMGMLSW
jgi:hypothetical protein